MQLSDSQKIDVKHVKQACDICKNLDSTNRAILLSAGACLLARQKMDEEGKTAMNKKKAV